LDRFRDDDPDNARFFAQGNGDRMLFDLPGYGLHRLRHAGVGQAEWTRHCTYRDPDRFYSFRRTTHAGEADYGRLISTIRPAALPARRRAGPVRPWRSGSPGWS
jgi:polyphenol oxidase